MSACPECGMGKTRVIDSRYCANGWTKRRRACDWGCSARWNTYEVPEDSLELLDPAGQADDDVEDGADANGQA